MGDMDTVRVPADEVAKADQPVKIEMKEALHRKQQTVCCVCNNKPAVPRHLYVPTYTSLPIYYTLSYMDISYPSYNRHWPACWFGQGNSHTFTHIVTYHQFVYCSWVIGLWGPVALCLFDFVVVMLLATLRGREGCCFKHAWNMLINIPFDQLRCVAYL